MKHYRLFYKLKKDKIGSIASHIEEVESKDIDDALKLANKRAKKENLRVAMVAELPYKQKELTTFTAVKKEGFK